MTLAWLVRQVLEEEGRYVAAAKQYWQEGQKLRAVESLQG